MEDPQRYRIIHRVAANQVLTTNPCTREEAQARADKMTAEMKDNHVSIIDVTVQPLEA